jgi:hypothetical protein
MAKIKLTLFTVVAAQRQAQAITLPRVIRPHSK